MDHDRDFKKSTDISRQRGRKRVRAGRE